MAADDYLPVTLCDAAGFLKRELAPYPGRLNVMLRCLLTSAIVIVVSMTLEVPELPLSLLVVFYVTQSNVVVTRLVGIMFMVGSTLAIGLSILLLKFTFDSPLLRIVIASLLFFGSVYLMRVLRIGVVFFIVAIVVIYVQSFVDRTDQADLLIRAALWVWVAVNYPIALTLVVNTLLLPAEPQLQLKAEIHRQLAAVETRLTQLIDGRANTALITQAAVQQGAVTLQKLLRFTTMRDAHYREHQALQLACVATVSRCERTTCWPA
jgi:multidrug resistance protein MdtO